MTTLKHYCSDEIASAFNAKLKDEDFVGLYKKAEDAWWTKGPASQAFKAEMDAAKTQPEAAAIHNKWLAAGSEGATALGKEHNDFTPMIEYSEDKQAALESVPQKAEDGCPEHVEAEDGCPQCADAGLAIAIDFAIGHVVKLADALDRVGFTKVAQVLDEALQKLSGQRPIVAEAKKKAKKGRSHSEWVSFLNKKSKKEGEKFSKTYKSALETAKKDKGLKGDKAEEYAIRTALDKVDKKYLDEPGPEHGPGKSGPLTSKSK